MLHQSTTSLPPDYDEFLELSARLGANFTRTQGAGGNTSIKHEGVLRVKASGKWLANAQTDQIMVPVAVERMRQTLSTDPARAEAVSEFVVEHLNAAKLRPSIETSFHAAIPQAVVAHFHCVNTIGLAVLERAELLIGERMARHVPDISWQFVPYRRPGVPVALEILKLVGKRPDVFVLANHGIIVAGDSVRQVAERIDRVTAALALTPRQSGEVAHDWLKAAASGTDFRSADDIGTHATALCSASLEIALGGSLYPDHVIFLGTELGVLRDGKTIPDVLKEFANRGAPGPKMLIAPGKGVLLSNKLTSGGAAMARCLADVVTRVPAGEAISYLGDAELNKLVNWEAETYRQLIDRSTEI